jgi:hypothetical protein
MRLNNRISGWVVSVLAVIVIAFALGCTGGGGGISRIPTPDDGEMYYEPVDFDEPGKIITDPDGNEIVSDRIWVLFKDGVEQNIKDSIIVGVGGRIVGAIPAIPEFNFCYIEVQTSTYEELEEIINQLKNNPDVETAEILPIMEIDLTCVTDVCNNYSIDDEEVWGFYRINMDATWRLLENEGIYTVNSPQKIKVAVIDTGVDTIHPDLKDNLVSESEWVDFVRTYIYVNEPEHSHGTHVAGIIAGVVNGEKLNGVAYRAQILPIKVGGKWGTRRVSPDAVVMGIAWAILKEAHVINLSLSVNREVLKQLQTVIYGAYNMKGIVIVSSAGNDSRDASNYLPSSLPEVISVGATRKTVDIFGERANFSNYSIDENLDVLTVAAPGNKIYSTIPSVIVGHNNYDYKNGTSMATPFVSGLAALLLHIDDSLSPEEVRNILIDTADLISVESSDGTPLVWRRINAYRAVSSIIYPSQGTISGSVRDAVTHDPLQDVSVDVYSEDSLIAMGETDANGIYSLLVPAGSGYEIEFSKAGYLTSKYFNITVEADTTTYLEAVLQIDTAYAGPGNVSGQILNALDGMGVSGLTINLREGINVTTGLIIATTTTQAGGSYGFTNLNAGHYTAAVSGVGWNTAYFTVICIGGTTTANQDATITPILAEGETRIVLTWTYPPSDLDSHLTGPIPGSINRFHVYWAARGSITTSPYARLDLDNVSRQTDNRPETITIYQQFDGVYRYSVHNYSNRSSTYSYALSNSNAQVRVYRGGNLIATFNVPANQEGTLWTVFELNDDIITPINAMSYHSSSGTIMSFPHVRWIETDAELMRNLPVKR